MEKINRPFRDLLNEHHVSQSEAAKLIGITQTTMSILCRLEYPLSISNAIRLKALKEALENGKEIRKIYERR